MANTFNFGNGEWARKTGEVLAYNSENDNYKPLPFTFDRASSATRVNKEGLIETVDVDEPRIDFLNNSKGHLLLEPESTNRTSNSEQPSTWHSSNGMTITANATTSPDGTSNASLAVRNASSGGIYTRNRFIFTTETGTQTVTGSYFVKYYNNQWVRLESIFFTGSPANSKCSFFDIQNGVLGTVDATHTAKIENYGSGWYRCSITFDIDKDSDTSGHIGYIQLEPMISDDTNTFAAIGQGYYAYGSQGEELSYPTSYIPTSGSAVTRSADTCKQENLPSASIPSAYPFTVFCDFEVPKTGQKTFAFSFADISSSARYFTFGYDIEGNNKMRFENRANGVIYGANSNSTYEGGRHKVAVKFISSTNFKGFVNGLEVVNYTHTASPFNSNINDVLLGQLRVLSDTGDRAPIHQFMIFNEALTDTELIALTS